MMRHYAFHRAAWKQKPRKFKARVDRGAPVSYGTEWGNRANAARRRDKNRCRICGRKPEKWEPRLAVHHVVPLKMWCGEGAADPHDLRNLLSVCGSCHGRLLMCEVRLFQGDVIGGWRAYVEAGVPREALSAAFGYFGLPEVR